MSLRKESGLDLSVVLTCELVEELKRREGVSSEFLKHYDETCVIGKMEYSGPGTIVLIVED